MAHILYISYDGMAEPLGQSQVIAYLERLADGNMIHILSFEKPADLADDAKMAVPRARLAAAGIGWTPMRYHKRPSAAATLYDIFRGQVMALRLARKMRAEIVHVRSYVPALIALPVKRLTGAKLLFDIRGFWADERVDGGLWSADGRIYRTVKRLERRLFRAADSIVTLTEASVPAIEAFSYWDGPPPPITVIPTCADLDRFDIRCEPHKALTVGYVGSVGTAYFFDEALRLFLEIRRRRPEAKLLVVNRNDHNLIAARLHELKVPKNSVKVVAAEYSEVPGYINEMTIATAFYRPEFSALGRAPTKLAEYLGCGVPCVGNTGVGDMESILEGDGTGVLLRAFDASSLGRAADRILALSADPLVRARCRNTALTRFSLMGGVTAYRSIYSRLTVLT